MIINISYKMSLLTGHNQVIHLSQEMFKSSNFSCGGHGVNLDNWSADSEGRGIAASGLHLHHPGGLPRTLDLPHLCAVLATSQRRLQEMVEGKGQRVRLPQQALWRSNKHIDQKLPCKSICI